MKLPEDKKKLYLNYIIIAIILVAIVIAGIILIKNTQPEIVEEETFTEEDEFQSESTSYVNTIDLYELQTLIDETLEKADAAYEMEQAARVLGYRKIVEIAMTDYQYNVDAHAYYTVRYDYVIDTYYSELQEKYPESTYIWIRLKACGFSDYVCAGILGNIMAECGGQTLKLSKSVWSSDSDYYGICQWRVKYYPAVNGLDLAGQVDFMLSNMEKIFDTYGDYDKFINAENEKDAALMFAKYYERCASESYSVRQVNATKAFEKYHIQEQ